MSVREAVTRAMRGDRMVVPGEFAALQSEAVAAVDITQMHTGDYLLRGDDAVALRGARFRNSSERREFYLGFLQQARERVLVQVLQGMQAIPTAERVLGLACYATRESHSEAVTCFQEADGQRSIWAGHTGTSEPPIGYYNGLLAFLGRSLPSNGFIGIGTASGGSEPLLGEIQLLDGIFFTTDNFRGESLPAETRISAGEIRALYRSSVCTEAPTLPDCR
ncbi:MAG: hypothetical protein K8R69_12095 [Deltaproteobacteria bacterium]|nr:hypothetical protein [Deltaproteobacteria bacterium]